MGTKTEVDECPFCRMPPDEQSNGFDGMKIAHRYKCISLRCPIQPATTWRLTRQEALDHWNWKARQRLVDMTGLCGDKEGA